MSETLIAAILTMIGGVIDEAPQVIAAIEALVSSKKTALALEPAVAADTATLNKALGGA